MAIIIKNCSWATSNCDNAIGDIGGNPMSRLSDFDLGTDEQDNTVLYDKMHAVYNETDPIPEPVHPMVMVLDNDGISGDFTIECNIRPNLEIGGEAKYQPIYYKFSGTYEDHDLIVASITTNWGNDPEVLCQVSMAIQSGNGTSYEAWYWNSPPITDIDWNHVAFVRSGTNRYIFINGVSGGSHFESGVVNPMTISDAYIGGTITDAIGSPEGHLDGQIDEFRISNIARYTTNFTPSESEFSSDDNTILLVHFDEEPVVDSSSYARTISLENGASINYVTRKFGAGSIDLTNTGGEPI